MRFILICVMTSILTLVAFCSFGAQEEFRALWVECEGTNSTLSTKEKIDAMLDNASKSNFNAVIVQVYRGNRCWYRSDIGDTTPYENARRASGIDPLAYVIEEGHKRGLQVHAWVNVFNLSRNTNAPVLKKLGREILILDNKGRSFLDYTNYKLPADELKHIDLSDEAIVLDPANDALREYQISVIKEILARYPKVDGIHLDFIRYPYTVPYSPGSRFSKSLQFGYTKAALDKYRKQTGRKPGDNPQEWDDFRREQVTAFVRLAMDACRKTNPPKQLSAAVLCWADRAYLSSYQDWRGWLEDGIVDFIVSMNYTRDRRFARYLSRAAALTTDKRNGYVGLQAYMAPVSSSGVHAQVLDARGAGAKGIVLFSYDSILKLQPEIFETLRKGAFKEKAVPPKR